MAQDIRIWEVDAANRLTEITCTPLGLEELLEDWLESDISMVSSDLIIIGRQVPTDFGRHMDLLCWTLGVM